MGHNRWPKHVAGYAVYNMINLHICILSRFGPCGLFLVPEVKILTKRSPISDGGGDRRKFDKGPSRHPAKHVPGRVPELEKTLGAVYQEWRGGGVL